MDFGALLSVKKDHSQKRAGCKGCKYEDRVFVPSYVAGSELIVVGEAPGKTEAEKKTPFVGKSGQLLRSTLSDVGFDVDKISFLNVVKCHPSEDNETPGTEEKQRCTKLFLLNELRELKPKLVVLAGGTALSMFMSKGTINEKRGNIFDYEGIKMLPVFHPAYCLRNQDATPVFVKDLKRAERYLRGDLSAGKKYKMVFSEQELEEAEKLLLTQKILSVDIETNKTLDPFEKGSSIWTIAFGYAKGEAICIPLDHPENINIPLQEKAWEVVRRIMNSSPRKVFHNASFDVKFLKYHGVETKNFWADTMVMPFLLDENKSFASLKQLASEYLDGYVDAWNTDLKSLAMYNCEDCDNTLQLYWIFLVELKKNPKLLNLFIEVLMPMIMVIVDMEFTGILIDINLAHKLTSLYKNKIEAVEDMIRTKEPRSVGINFSSSQQVGTLLFKTLGYVPPKRTGTGQASVDYESLTALVNQGCGLATDLLKIHKFEKLLSTYIQKLPSIVKSDSRLRGSFNICGARTGRLSSSNPNLQNIPRSDEIKRLFIPQHGWVFLNIDASQAELRVGCSIAKDAVMIDAYNKEVDVHRLTAATMLKKAMQEVNKKERQAAKPVNFGLIYGQSAEGLRMTAKNDYDLDLSVNECEMFRTEFFKLYRGFINWHEVIKADLKKYGYIEYPTGRRRHFPQAKGVIEAQLPGDIFRSAVNAPVQGSSSDIVLFMITRLSWFIQERKLPARLLVTVHDSISLEADSGVQEPIIQEVRRIAKVEIAEAFTWLKVPMVFDFSVGKSWGDLKEIKNS